MKKRWLVLPLCFLLLLATALPASAANGYSKREIVIVGEPDTGNTKYVEYYTGDKLQSLEDMTWVEGRFGKAVELNGKGQLLQVPDYPLLVSEFSIAGWFKWYGNVDGSDTPVNQHFFSFIRGKQTLFTVYPCFVNDDGSLLGNRLCLSKYDSKGWDLDFSRQMISAAPAAWPKNEWHHLAITLDRTTIRYYVDGKLVYEQLLVLGFSQMKFSALLIGDSAGSDPSFYGAVDELSIYDIPLTEAQVERLAAGISIQDKTTPITTTTTTEPTATSTTAVTDVTTTERTDGPDIKGPIPLIVPVGIAGGAIIVILFSIIFKRRTL